MSKFEGKFRKNADYSEDFTYSSKKQKHRSKNGHSEAAQAKFQMRELLSDINFKVNLPNIRKPV